MTARSDHDVVRFDVAMNDAVCMEEVYGTAHLRDEMLRDDFGKALQRMQ